MPARVNVGWIHSQEWCIDLRHSMLDQPAGAWWMLREDDTGFSDARAQHPWILHVAYSARLAFGHGCPRTRNRQSWDEHPAHPLGHESMCQLNDRGWVLPASARPLRGEWLDNGFYSCTEPDQSPLLGWICAEVGETKG